MNKIQEGFRRAVSVLCSDEVLIEDEIESLFATWFSNMNMGPRPVLIARNPHECRAMAIMVASTDPGLVESFRLEYSEIRKKMFSTLGTAFYSSLGNLHIASTNSRLLDNDITWRRTPESIEDTHFMTGLESLRRKYSSRSYPYIGQHHRPPLVVPHLEPHRIRSFRTKFYESLTYLSRSDRHSLYANSEFYPETPPYQKIRRDAILLSQIYQKVWGFIVLPNFVVVSRLPLEAHTDELGRLHSTEGPAVRWDGLDYYFLMNHKTTKEGALTPEVLTFSQVMKIQNAELRAYLINRIGWVNLLKSANSRIIDLNEDKSLGDLVEVTYRRNSQSSIETYRILRAMCPRNGMIAEMVPERSDIDRRSILTARAAQAWRIGLSEEDYVHPPRRT